MFKNKNKEFKFGVLLIALEMLTFIILLSVNISSDLESICVLYISIVSLINICWLMLLVSHQYSTENYSNLLDEKLNLKAMKIKLLNKKKMFKVSLAVLALEAIYLISILVTSMCIALPLIMMLISFTFINFINLSFLIYLISNKQREEEMLLNLIEEKEEN